jgi:hypothetical protein
LILPSKNLRYTLIVHNTLLTFIPFRLYQDVEVFFILWTLLAPVVFLMLFVKNKMGGKYENNEQNTELSRAVFLQIAVNSLGFLWISASLWSFIVLLSNA